MLGGNMKEEVRSRKWFCRISETNHTKNEGIYQYDFQNIYNILSSRYDFVMYIIHDKNENNIHAHYIIQNNTQIKKSTLINVMPYGDIEVQRGSNLECYEYLLHRNQDSKEEYLESNIICNKLEVLEQWLYVKKEQSNRKDFLNGVYNFVDKKELRELYPNEYLIHYSKLEKMQNDCMREKANVFRDIKIVYVYGNNIDLFLKPLISYFLEENVDYFHINDYEKDPFNTYNGEKIIVSNLDAMFSGLFFSTNRWDVFFSNYPNTQIYSRYGNKYLLYDFIFLFCEECLYDLKSEYINMIVKNLFYIVSIDEPFIRMIKNGEVLFESGIANQTKLKEMILHMLCYRSDSVS